MHDPELRLLLIEDSPWDAELVSLCLSEETSVRFNLSQASNICTAVDLIGQQKCDVILLDLTLPDSCGLDTLNKVKSADPNVPIVILSGEDSVDLAITALKNGAQDFLVKQKDYADFLVRSLLYAMERKKSEQHLEKIAKHDDLTGAINRSCLRESMLRAFHTAKRNDQIVGLLLLDLDRFKEINDTFGHAAGDKALKVVTKRLTSALRKDDIVVRLGGDEFAVIISSLGKREYLADIAGKISKTITAPIKLDGAETVVGTSIGIAIYPDSGEQPEILLKRADIALYASKEAGKGCYRFYEAGMNFAASERTRTVDGLRKALDNDQYSALYQPIFDLRSERLVAFETLLRWNKGGENLVPPVQFLSTLEESGLILQVGEWLMREACTQAKSWRDRQGLPVRISVNVASRQLNDKDFDKTIQRILDETGLEPQYLDLEISERLLTPGTDHKDSIKRLKDKGVRLTIDNFGERYGSINHLKQYPFDAIKLDADFSNELQQGHESLLTTFVDLAHGLRCSVATLGVEGQSQLDFFMQSGLDEVQGFFVGKPVSCEYCFERVSI